MSQLQVLCGELQTAFDTLSKIARSKGFAILSVTVNINGTDLNSHVLGSVTVKGKSWNNSRSRRVFKIVKVCDGVQVEFMGVKAKIAA